MICGYYIIYVMIFLSATYADHGWDYHENGPSVWSQTYPECGGQRQSPVLLNSEDAIQSSARELRPRGLVIRMHDYQNVAPAIFSNNGHSVNLAFNYTNPKQTPRVVASNQYGTSNTYLLQGLHFHWPSEHWVDNVSYPLEMHMVHLDKENNRNLVLGYPFVACSGSSFFRWIPRAATGLDDVATAVRGLQTVGAQVDFSGFAPRRVMPRSLNSCGYFLYSGSLTTPPCTEGVTWLVHREPLCVEEWQLDAFYRVRDSHGQLMLGNFRPLQPLNKRSVAFVNC